METNPYKYQYGQELVSKESKRLARIYEEGRKAGIKEVVECMTNDFRFSPTVGSGHYEMWQAKLKEWGIIGETKK